MENIIMRREMQETQENEIDAQRYEEYLRGQNLIQISKLIPKNMQNQKEIFEELGFRFYSFAPNEKMYSTILPEGWDLKPTQNVLWTKIVDDNGFTRGLIYYNAVKNTSSVSLRNRYGIHTQTTTTNTPEGIVVEKRVYFGDEENMLHIAGYVGANLNEENAEEKLAQSEMFKKVAKDYADRKYPGWEDVRLYWGTPKAKQYTR
jgi:hypothetical protein